MRVCDLLNVESSDIKKKHAFKRKLRQKEAKINGVTDELSVPKDVELNGIKRGKFRLGWSSGG